MNQTGVLLLLFLVPVLLLIFYYRSQSTSQPTKKQCMVRILPNILTKEECTSIVQQACPQLQQSLVYKKGGSEMRRDARVSSQAWMNATDHPALQKLSALACTLTGKPVSHQEKIQIVKYSTGGFFQPHYDPCNGNAEYCQSFTQSGGQRHATLLVYLNDDFEGGHTRFPLANVDIEPKCGWGILFFSTDGAQKVLKHSQHGGDPVTKGEKWIANVWVRHQPVQ